MLRITIYFVVFWVSICLYYTVQRCRRKQADLSICSNIDVQSGFYWLLLNQILAYLKITRIVVVLDSHVWKPCFVSLGNAHTNSSGILHFAEKRADSMCSRRVLECITFFSEVQSGTFPARRSLSFQDASINFLRNDFTWIDYKNWLARCFTLGGFLIYVVNCLNLSFSERCAFPNWILVFYGELLSRL